MQEPLRVGSVGVVPGRLIVEQVINDTVLCVRFSPSRKKQTAKYLLRGWDLSTWEKGDKRELTALAVISGVSLDIEGTPFIVEPLRQLFSWRYNH